VNAFGTYAWRRGAHSVLWFTAALDPSHREQFYAGLNLYEDFYIYTNRGLGNVLVAHPHQLPPRDLALQPDAAGAPEERASRRQRSRACNPATAPSSARTASSSEESSRARLSGLLSMLDLAIIGATAVTPSATKLWMSASRMAKIAGVSAPGKLEQATSTIDARGMLLLPGAVDPHTHLDAEMFGATTADDFESGTIAAAAGGVNYNRRLCVPGRWRIAERGDFEVG